MGLIFLRNRVSGAAPTFDPATLFASGEQGGWYDPSDLTTMWTDTAGTTQAGVGDAVARIDDKSGNGNHATQGTAPARPILRQTAGGLYYLEFDGTDDVMSTSAFSLSAGSQVSAFAAVETVSGGSGETVFHSQDATGNYRFALIAPQSATNHFQAFARGTTAVIVSETGAGFAPPVAAVATMEVDVGVGNSVSLRLNGVLSGTASGLGTAGTFSASNSFVFGSLLSSAFSAFEGKIFGLIVRGASSDATEISNTEAYLAAKSGVTL